MKKTMLAVLAASLLGAPVISEAGFIYSWEIYKTADQSDLTLAVDELFLVTYTVTVISTITGESETDIDLVATVSDSLLGYLGTLIGAFETGYSFTYLKWVGPYDAPGFYELTNTATYVTNTGTTDSASWTINVTVPGTSVPEPGTLALLGLGMTGLALSRKRKAN